MERLGILHRQFDAHRLLCLHQLGPNGRITEDQQLGRPQLHVDGLGVGGVVDPRHHPDVLLDFDYWAAIPI